MRTAALWLISLAVCCSVAAAFTPADLRRIEDQSSVELTTIGRESGKPRAVTIWFVTDDGTVYVQSGKEGKTHWYRNLLENPAVSLRFDEVVLRGRAEPVSDPALREHVHELFRRKYWTARIMGWFGGEIGQGEVVRIEPEPKPPQ